MEKIKERSAAPGQLTVKFNIMIIDITQKKISLGSHYNIMVDDVEKYEASGHTFPLLGGTITISDQTGNQFCSIKKQFYIFRPYYKIGFPSGVTCDFRAINVFKGVYSCTSAEAEYDFYKHKGHLGSIYKNNIQVASIVRDPFKVLKGDNYHILADDDVDFKLIISLTIIYDDFSHKSSNTDIGTIDLGNILFEEKEFDETWKPKIVQKT